MNPRVRETGLGASHRFIVSTTVQLRSSKLVAAYRGAEAVAPTALGVFTELSEEQPGERAARPERSGRSAGAVRYLDLSLIHI